MKEYMRLDKYLCEFGIGTRSQVKDYIKKGRVTINGLKVTKPEVKLNKVKDLVTLDDRVIQYTQFEYYMLNKPQGVVSATKDNYCSTVIDLLTTSSRKDLFPVGRLDKDTEGLLLITNDGILAHQLLSPKRHVGKTYFAYVEGRVSQNEILAFSKGVMLDDYKTLPADLEIIKSNEISEVKLTIYEGKFHQVKRMFEAVGMKILFLKRLSMGELYLDESLEPGNYRPLTNEELNKIKGI